LETSGFWASLHPNGSSTIPPLSCTIPKQHQTAGLPESAMAGRVSPTVQQPGDRDECVRLYHYQPPQPSTTPLPSATAATARSYGVAEYPHRYPGCSALRSALCALHPQGNILSSLTSTIDPTATSLVSRLLPSRTPLSFNGNTGYPRHALHAGREWRSSLEPTLG
jgi:hypothetical protein